MTAGLFTLKDLGEKNPNLVLGVGKTWDKLGSSIFVQELFCP